MMRIALICLWLVEVRYSLAQFPATFLMENFGRRFWTQTMLPGRFIGLAITGASYLVGVEKNPKTTEGLYLTGLIISMHSMGPMLV